MNEIDAAGHDDDQEHLSQKQILLQATKGAKRDLFEAVMRLRGAATASGSIRSR
jgi:hypothetical protein